MKTYIYGAIIIVITVLSLATAFFVRQTSVKAKEVSELKQINSGMRIELTKLSTAYLELVKVKTYSISLAPNINSKMATAFGSMRDVVFQYYFTMDGNKLIVKPDSVYEIRKLE